MKLGDYLEKNSIKKKDFAKRVGITRVSLHRIIHGKQTPRPGLLSRIIGATGGEVTLAELIAFESGK